MMGSMDKEKSYALLDAFVEAGGNFIDTYVLTYLFHIGAWPY
jgi:hypothetical protein